VAETWRRVWGTENFFADQDFRISEKNVISRRKFLITFFCFFSHRPGFTDFPYLYCIKCRIRHYDTTTLRTTLRHYDTTIRHLMSSQEKPLFQNRIPWKHFFTLFVLSHASDNTTSQNIGRTDAWAVPPPQIWGGTVPSVPLRSPPWFVRKTRRCTLCCTPMQKIQTMEIGKLT